MGALSHAVEVDRPHGQVEPIGRVLGQVIHEPSQKTDGESDAERDAEHRRDPFVMQGAAEPTAESNGGTLSNVGHGGCHRRHPGPPGADASFELHPRTVPACP